MEIKNGLYLVPGKLWGLAWHWVGQQVASVLMDVIVYQKCCCCLLPRQQQCCTKSRSTVCLFIPPPASPKSVHSFSLAVMSKQTRSLGCTELGQVCCLCSGILRFSPAQFFLLCPATDRTVTCYLFLMAVWQLFFIWKLVGAAKQVLSLQIGACPDACSKLFIEKQSCVEFCSCETVLIVA